MIKLGHLPPPDLRLLTGFDQAQDGILPPARLELDQTGRIVPVGSSGADAFYRELLDRISELVGGPVGGHGTAGGRVISDPCEAGRWHSDDGGAQARIVATWAPHRPDLRVGHEFAGEGMLDAIAESGEVVLFTSELHRRPCIPVATRRIFVSVSIYYREQDADLSCPLLAGLR